GLVAGRRRAAGVGAQPVRLVVALHRQVVVRVRGLAPELLVAPDRLVDPPVADKAFRLEPARVGPAWRGLGCRHAGRARAGGGGGGGWRNRPRRGRAAMAAPRASGPPRPCGRSVPRGGAIRPAPTPRRRTTSGGRPRRTAGLSSHAPPPPSACRS